MQHSMSAPAASGNVLTTMVSFSPRFSFGFAFLRHGFSLALLAKQWNYDLQTFDFALYPRLLQFFFPQKLVYIFQRIFPPFFLAVLPWRSLAMTVPLCAAWAHPVPANGLERPLLQAPGVPRTNFQPRQCFARACQIDGAYSLLLGPN
jgi:hypothetical protein